MAREATDREDYSNEAADLLGTFERPALIAWSREDRFFKAADGEQLARDLPAGRLEWIETRGRSRPRTTPSGSPG